MAELSGPLEGPPVLISTSFDLDVVGYRTEEYLVAGTATAYEPDGDTGDDGRWEVRAAGEAGFCTRIVVNRPNEGFNGTVVVEWLNVSSGADVAAEWLTVHRHLVRERMAWVGVSAQREGVVGGGAFRPERDGAGWFPALPSLKSSNPVRYAALEHPGDAFSYDIFTQAGRLVQVLLPTDCLLAAGASQSAAYLVTYVNAVAARTGVYDGFLVHGRPGRPADLQGWDGEVRAGRVRVRDDSRAPVLTLQTETDVVGVLQSLESRQPDSECFRLWEIAGASHADLYTIKAGFQDSGEADIAELLAPTSSPLGPDLGVAINSGLQQHYVGQAAVAALERWVRERVSPGTAVRLETAGEELVLDADGLARGGVRTPWVDVPTGVLSGLGQEKSGGAALLYGTTVPFDGATLAERYPGGRDDYLAAFSRSAEDAVANGFLLAADVAEARGFAATAFDRLSRRDEPAT
ncbi:alpha/beta hydrolase domain-containing protein [Cryptosporangium sp. NPDC048952]|uniref:alpha/beta hydrolase domain-containing protein n=1 Tax=Cryptosporangium sp. NPDC048952 TaxID=3363961 RepID=UPI00371BFF3C